MDQVNCAFSTKKKGYICVPSKNGHCGKIPQETVIPKFEKFGHSEGSDLSRNILTFVLK